MSFPDRVAVYEVGPRDGLQNEPAPVPTEVKIELIQRLAATGLPYIELTSFVHPRWIPQLGDAEQVFSGSLPSEGCRYGALVPNLRGWQRAEESGLRAPAVFVSASETHNQKNLNRSIEESLANTAELLEAAQSTGQVEWIRGYISMVFGCPYEGETDIGNVIQIALRLLELGVDQISLGDTVGHGTPRSVAERVEIMAKELPIERLALHFHDTRGTALANVVAGLDVGVRNFDSTVGGLGGCPYAPGASGNLATEDLVQVLQAMGVETGVDLEALLDASIFIEEHLKKPLPSRYLRAARGNCRWA